MSTINDATGEIDAGIATAGGTLDIVKMEVGDTETDVVFKLTLNGNITSTDWGNFMIGIANQKTNGTTSGNGWSRPINLNAGVTNGVTNGMTHWIGSWVSGGGGAQLWTHNGTSWSESAATYSGNLPGFSLTPGVQSIITYTVAKTSLGVVNGDTIRFDAYSSGGGGGDSAVDALANPNTSITGWGGPYTSSGANLAGYTLANTMLNTTQTITFSVDMNHQIILGTFVPGADAVTVDWGSGFPINNFSYLTDDNNDGIYTGTATISAPEAATVPYRFTIEPADTAAPLLSETVSRSFVMPGASAAIASNYFNNIEGYRDVTFTVNMSVQTTLGTFNPATQTVEVRGPFNGWAGTALTAQGEGVYSGTVRVSGSAGPLEYKFFAGNYEGVSNRSFTLAFNSDRAPTPALALEPAYFNNQNTVPDFRAVTFAVNMNRQISLGTFSPSTGVVEIRGQMNGWGGGTAWQLTDGDNDGIYTGTFSLEGAAALSLEYKFHATGPGWESVPNRSVTLGPIQQAQTVPVVFFNNDSGATRQVTFAVDMSIQQQLGNFNPATGTVQLRGLGSFDAADKVLAREGDTLIYKGTFAVGGDAGSAVAYKFFSAGVTASGFEVVNPNDLFQNRSLTLGASDSPMVLDPVYFSNQSAIPPSLLSYTPSSISGTVGTAISSLTPTVTGTVTTYSINPALPAGLSIDSTSGVISGTPTAVSAPATYTVTASNGGGSTTTTLNIGVTASGSSFSSWSGNATLDAANLAKYAIGGATSLAANDGLALVAGGDATTLTLTAIVRTDDNTLTITGEASTGLDSGWSSSDVSVSDAANQVGVPQGCTRKVFSVARGSDDKKFIRIKATKP